MSVRLLQNEVELGAVQKPFPNRVFTHGGIAGGESCPGFLREGVCVDELVIGNLSQGVVGQGDSRVRVAVSLEPSRLYAVMSEGPLAPATDLLGQDWGGLVNVGDWNFATAPVVPPGVVSRSPLGDVTPGETDQLVVVFDQVVVGGRTAGVRLEVHDLTLQQETPQVFTPSSGAVSGLGTKRLVVSLTSLPPGAVGCVRASQGFVEVWRGLAWPGLAWPGMALCCAVLCVVCVVLCPDVVGCVRADPAGRPEHPVRLHWHRLRLEIQGVRVGVACAEPHHSCEQPARREPQHWCGEPVLQRGGDGGCRWDGHGSDRGPFGPVADPDL